VLATAQGDRLSELRVTGHFKLLGSRKAEHWDFEHGTSALEELAVLLDLLTKRADLLGPKLKRGAQRAWRALRKRESGKT
jgi:hypothetical protein